MKKLLLLLPPSGMLFVIDAETIAGLRVEPVEKAIAEREALVRRVVRRTAAA